MTFRTASGQDVPVRLEVNPRAKRLILRLDQKNREAVAVAPSQRQLKAAAAFAEQRLDWIASRLEAVPEAKALTEGAIIPLRAVPTRITAEGTGRLPKLISGDPQTLSLPGAPETLAARALRYLKREAKADLTAASNHYADLLGVKINRISVKDTRSRWGSCTVDGNLSYSWRLILAEPFVLDYVAAHEVAHRVEMNHSPAFWAEVEKIYPDWKTASSWLKTHSAGLHAIGG
ncbi:MAG: SprT family zinc-dependent metalloprotease [Pseudomonadota bacterium]